MVRNRPLEVMKVAGVVLAGGFSVGAVLAVGFIVMHFVVKFW